MPFGTSLILARWITIMSDVQFSVPFSVRPVFRSTWTWWRGREDESEVLRIVRHCNIVDGKSTWCDAEPVALRCFPAIVQAAQSW